LGVVLLVKLVVEHTRTVVVYDRYPIEHRRLSADDLGKPLE